MIPRVNVKLWGRTIGAAAPNPNSPGFFAFEFDPDYLGSHANPAPLTMPDLTPYTFRDLPEATFHGLPGMLADSLPDRYGNALIDAWLAQQGRTPASFNALERLCYLGTRGMGALEFEPALETGANMLTADRVDVDRMVELATAILARHANAQIKLAIPDEDDAAMRQILSIGSSPGGARAKALISWNPATNEILSGHVQAPPGFEAWIIKFDGVAENRDHDLADPLGYSLIEYAYYLMAVESGIEMSECRLLTHNGLHHFMTRRFDRRGDGTKLLMQSLGALRHFDFNDGNAPHGYEQAMETCFLLGLGQDAVEQQFRRMVFNVLSRNQDDHVKNISFLMTESGEWRLSPAYDVTFSFNPDGWTQSHQMRVAGKRSGITRDDLLAAGSTGNIKSARCEAIIDATSATIARWPEFAATAGVSDERAVAIGNLHEPV